MIKAVMKSKKKLKTKKSKYPTKLSTEAKPSTDSPHRTSKKVNTAKTASHSKWIPIKEPLKLSLAVRTILQRLNQSGYEAYLVGGAIRDHLLSARTVLQDHDIVTSALPDEIQNLFPHSVDVGKSFGVIKIPIAESGVMVDVATFRKDGFYRDQRHPEQVIFASIVEDSARRDFTVNALYYDVKTQSVCDLEGGLVDLQQKVIRAVGDPQQRFKEDALRILRAVRFAAQLGFKIELKTLAALKAHVILLRKISTERVQGELFKILKTPFVHEGLQQLVSTGIFFQLYSEFPQTRIQFWITRTSDFLRQAQKFIFQEFPESFSQEVILWSLFFMEFPDQLGPKLIPQYKFSKVLSDQILHFLEEVHLFKECFEMRESKLIRFVSQPFFRELLAIERCRVLATDGNLMAIQMAYQRFEDRLRSPQIDLKQILNGDHLKDLGIKPGPLYAEILHEVEDLVLEQKVSTHEQAMEYVLTRLTES